ncbi:MAG: asparaginase domain-containing protein [Acutalibacteraceae bacterium]
MKKILLVFTGGTIGSKTSGGITNVDDTAKYRLIEKYYEKYGDNAEFECISPLNILSENLQLTHWQTLYDAVCEKLSDSLDFGGIIIAHGSDTLAYTAAAMSFLLSGIKIPALLIAADRSIDDERSNGVANFAAAVEFINNTALPGIFAIYRDKDDKMPVYLGTRLNPADDTDRFSSYHGVDFGEMINGNFALNRDSSNPTAADLSKKAVGLQKSPLKFCKNVVCLSPYPSLDYSSIILNPAKTAAVLHTLYHSSTACTSSGDNSLIQFAEKLISQNIPLYLLGAAHFDDDSVYQTAAELQSSGAVPLHGISPTAAFAKICIAHNVDNLDARRYVQNNIFFEYICQQ